MNMMRPLPEFRKPAASYLNLTASAWSGLLRAWDLPRTRALLRQAYLLGPLRSLAAWFQSLVVGRADLADVDVIFVLGFWRSGTTLLHELLAADDRFSYPSSYACFHPHHFLFTEKIATARNNAVTRRPQDQMTTGWRTPQEDEFALLCLGARSPYEGLIAAGEFGSALKLADPDELGERDRQRWVRAFGRFIATLRRANGGRPLVLKSPPHSYRVRALRRLLPKARFVVMVRNPFDIFESMMKTYRAFTLHYGLTPALANRELREIILEERLRCEEKLQLGLSGLGKDRLAIIRYEDLTAEPLGTVENLYRQFGLPDFEKVRPKLLQRNIRAGRPARPAAQPPPQWRDRVKADWSILFSRYGYDLEGLPLH